jgi:uncharacterized Zn finger protein
MGWYYDYKPYVPVAKRRQQAQREMEKRRKQGHAVSPIVIDGRKIAKTFWGNAWCDNLESYSDYANRLPRGRTYVRNGSVVHLEIKAGKISALVSGSELYKVEITISALPHAHWKCVKDRCAGQIGSLVELLQGKLSKSVMEVVTQRGGGLFPKPAEIEMKCSCPDWAGMCKHVAAVMYGIGARLDQKPELLFLLRKVDHLELIEGAVDAGPVSEAGKPKGKKTIATAELADVFGIEMAEAETSAKVAPAKAKANASRPPKARVSTAKAASKKTTKRAGAGAKNTATARTKKPAKAKTAQAESQKSAKPASRKRLKPQPV